MASFTLSLAILATAFPLYVSAATVGSEGFSINLIHRNSPKSPLYDPSATEVDRMIAAAYRSVARAAYRISASDDGGSIVSPLTPDDGEYLMELQLGTPPMKIIAIADSGSDLTWTNCKPCSQCFSQKPPLFDPEKSSTYGKISCGTGTCDALPTKACERGSTCLYDYSYGDRSNVGGVLSTEAVTFSSTNGSQVVMENIKFGCNSRSRGSFNNKTSGLVGLGAGPLSLVSQLSSSFQKKFSYCLLPMTSSSSSKISFGATDFVSGRKAVSTPLKIVMETFYSLNLEEIIVGGKSVDVTSVSPLVFGSGNIMIDSGTTLTLLDGGVIKGLVKALEGEISFPTVSDPTGVGFPACYNISGSSDAVFPDMIFKFESAAAVVLKPLNTFLKADDNTICLAVTTASAGLLQIFGNIAQQNFHVQYDLVANEVSFAPVDCSKI